jgi:hypothetical protein
LADTTAVRLASTSSSAPARQLDLMHDLTWKDAVGEPHISATAFNG